MDLFKSRAAEVLRERAPLADRMRPRTLDEFIGQEHIIGPGRLLRRAIQIDQLSSVIFYGPPGTGKTTLARIIANTTRAQFLSINAVLAGVKEIRESVDAARQSLELHSRRTILFVDEVHRFNKAQQDALLPHVESGLMILIGATTENPYFEVNKALVSRSRIFQLRKLGPDDLKRVAQQAIADTERGYGRLRVTIDDQALDHLVNVANGDARGVLNALELAIETTTPDADGAVCITPSVAEESIQQRAVLYDKDGDAHYDTISAFIKSLRGSDPDAALYWMARMVYAGEDPRFIFRRMAIFACEDIGLADPEALRVVMSASQAFDFIGLPEGRFHLAFACIYCATAPKSNSTMAFFDALDVVGKEMEAEVPTHLMDASRDGEGFGHGKGYLYPHAYRDHWVAQQYLPSALQGRVFYQPSEQGAESVVRERVLRLREAQVEAMVDPGTSGILDGEGSAGGQGQWMQRLSARRGDLLGRIRDRLLSNARIGPDSIVLDTHGRTGLLALEAARRVEHGAVWTVAHDERALQTLSGIASRLDTLERPQIVRADWGTLAGVVREAAGAQVLFSAIVGRSIVGSMDNPSRTLSDISQLLAPGGTFALAEIVPGAGQRVCDICAEAGVDSKLLEALRAAENDLYSAPHILSAPKLRELTEALAGCAASVEITEEPGVRRFNQADVTQWFRTTTAGHPESLGGRVRAIAGEQISERVHAAIASALCGRDLSWTTGVAYVTITRRTPRAQTPGARARSSRARR